MKKTLCFFLCIWSLLLCGCAPSLKFLREKEQGLYPDTSDFPNTKWECRELDMYFYMLDYNEDYMIGVYTVDNVSYRVVGTFRFNQLSFEIFSHTQISLSEYKGDDDISMVNCERISCGYINTNYSYNDESIVCSLLNYQPVDGEVIPTTLTFDKTESITKNVDTCWRAQELDMYLNSLTDVSGYFTGEIVINEEKHYIHAFEIGNNNYYMLSIENGKINNSIPRTTSPLICMYFEVHENQIIATISDEYIVSSVMFPYWEYNGATITFKPLVS